MLDITIETKNVSCTGMIQGSAQATVFGGIAPYNYTWDNGDVSANISGLATGTYILTVHDQNGCVLTDTAIIGQNTEVQLDIQIVEPISCYQMSDGILQAVATDGVGPYTYRWQDESSIQILNNAGEGVYSVTVTDSEGCVGHESIDLTDPEPLKADVEVTEARCYGSTDGTVILGANGGTADYQYTWNSSVVSGYEVSNLTSGSYNLIVVDGHSCFEDTVIFVGQPEKLHVSVDEFYTVRPFCPDWQNGALAVKVTGGTSGYEYYWPSPNEDNDSILEDIKEGNYNVRVRDAHECIVDTSFRLMAINNTCLGIPSAFTPNPESDAANNTWDIRYINENGGEALFHEVYPAGEINIYDRLGTLVYKCSGGCPEQWNGEDLKGRRLPVDTYYYIIELNTGSGVSTLKGIVTIIR
jgi:gliding motility-associated-like protein